MLDAGPQTLIGVMGAQGEQEAREGATSAICRGGYILHLPATDCYFGGVRLDARI